MNKTLLLISLVVFGTAALANTEPSKAPAPSVNSSNMLVVNGENIEIPANTQWVEVQQKNDGKTNTITVKTKDSKTGKVSEKTYTAPSQDKSNIVGNIKPGPGSSSSSFTYQSGNMSAEEAQKMADQMAQQQAQAQQLFARQQQQMQQQIALMNQQIAALQGPNSMVVLDDQCSCQHHPMPWWKALWHKCRSE